jgi:hypothetical protein
MKKTWTEHDDSVLMAWVNRGASIPNIAKHMKRTESSINSRLYIIRHMAHHDEKWTEEQINHLANNMGASNDILAIELNKSFKAINQMRFNLKHQDEEAGNKEVEELIKNVIKQDDNEDSILHEVNVRIKVTPDGIIFDGMGKESLFIIFDAEDTDIAEIKTLDEVNGLIKNNELDSKLTIGLIQPVAITKVLTTIEGI